MHRNSRSQTSGSPKVRIWSRRSLDFTAPRIGESLLHSPFEEFKDSPAWEWIALATPHTLVSADGAGSELERFRRGAAPHSTSGSEVAVLSCDYNGWNDMPEDEREWVDQYRDTGSELSRDPAFQSTQMENTSWPLPDLSTCTMANRAGPAFGTSSRA